MKIFPLFLLFITLPISARLLTRTNYKKARAATHHLLALRTMTSPPRIPTYSELVSTRDAKIAVAKETFTTEKKRLLRSGYKHSDVVIHNCAQARDARIKQAHERYNDEIKKLNSLMENRPTGC
jgi:predicted negative regulator of RcsB-dependent stress response